MALYFEDFRVGDRYTTVGRTVTEADIVNFAGLSGDYNPLHLDREHAAGMPFGERIAHGMLTLSITSGQFNQLGLVNETVIAFMEMHWKFKGAVKIGDTVHSEIGVLDVQKTSKPGRGVVTVEFDVRNQRGETVQLGTFALLVRSRE